MMVEQPDLGWVGSTFKCSIKPGLTEPLGANCQLLGTTRVILMTKMDDFGWAGSSSLDNILEF